MYGRYFAARLGKKITGFAPAVLTAFDNYAWPGNLRELRNAVERAVILTQGGIIELADLPETFQEKSNPAVAVGARVSLDAARSRAHLAGCSRMARNLDEAARSRSGSIRPPVSQSARNSGGS